MAAAPLKSRTNSINSDVCKSFVCVGVCVSRGTMERKDTRPRWGTETIFFFFSLNIRVISSRRRSDSPRKQSPPPNTTTEHQPAPPNCKQLATKCGHIASPTANSLTNVTHGGVRVEGERSAAGTLSIWRLNLPKGAPHDFFFWDSKNKFRTPERLIRLKRERAVERKRKEGAWQIQPKRAESNSLDQKQKKLQASSTLSSEREKTILISKSNTIKSQFPHAGYMKQHHMFHRKVALKKKMLPPEGSIERTAWRVRRRKSRKRLARKAGFQKLFQKF